MFARRRAALVAAVSLALVAPARADEPPASPGGARRALAAGAAIVPGVIVRGAGHWVAGERRTARRLLLIEGLGLGLVAAGGIPIGVSGGAGESMPGLALLLPGSALLFTSIAADVWGAAGGAAIAGQPLTPDVLTLSLGYTFVADPRTPFANLATAAAEARLGRVMLGASGWFGDHTRRARATTGYRLLGPVPGQRGHDALDLSVAVAHEARTAHGYAVTTAEAAMHGRLDLAHVGPSLRGSFVAFGLGLGTELIDYDAAGVTDTSGLVTGHFGWGFVLGDGHARALEAELYYEHRRDTLAGGVTLPTPGNGFVGYFGGTVTAWRERWGLTATVDAGSAWIVALAARVRLPEVSR
jgi:hypothetical protein